MTQTTELPMTKPIPPPCAADCINYSRSYSAILRREFMRSSGAENFRTKCAFISPLPPPPRDPGKRMPEDGTRGEKYLESVPFTGTRRNSSRPSRSAPRRLPARLMRANIARRGQDRDHARGERILQALRPQHGPGGGKRELPDHLCAELEFLHFLAFKEAQARKVKIRSF